MSDRDRERYAYSDVLRHGAPFVPMKQLNAMDYLEEPERLFADIDKHIVSLGVPVIVSNMLQATVVAADQQPELNAGLLDAESALSLSVRRRRKIPWRKELFTPEWLMQYYKDTAIAPRNIFNKDEEIYYNVGSYLNMLQQATTMKALASETPDQRHNIILYAKDVVCPPDWEDHLAEVLDHRFMYNGGSDYFSHLDPQLRAINLMVYMGTERTSTPAHTDICASLAHNVMVYAEEGAHSIWFVASQSDKAIARERWSTKDFAIDLENHFIPLELLAKSDFPVHLTQQNVGDLVLLPPDAVHQVVNKGGLSIKMAWNRHTCETLLRWYHTRLNDFYHNIMKPEVYRNKLMVFETIKHLITIIGQKLLQNTFKRQAQEQLAQTLAEFSIMLDLYRVIVSDEYIDLGAVADNRLPEEDGTIDSIEEGEVSAKLKSLLDIPLFADELLSSRSCDFCHQDIFNRCFHCDHCNAKDDGVTDETAGYDLCCRCYGMGRTCAGKHDLNPHAYYSFETLLKVYEDSRQLLSRLSNDSGRVVKIADERKQHIIQQTTHDNSLLPASIICPPFYSENQMPVELYKRRSHATVAFDMHARLRRWPVDYIPSLNAIPVNKPFRKAVCHQCGSDNLSRLYICSEVGCRKFYCDACSWRLFKTLISEVVADRNWRCWHCQKKCQRPDCPESNLVIADQFAPYVPPVIYSDYRSDTRNYPCHYDDYVVHSRIIIKSVASSIIAKPDSGKLYRRSKAGRLVSARSLVDPTTAYFQSSTVGQHDSDPHEKAEMTEGDSNSQTANGVHEFGKMTGVLPIAADNSLSSENIATEQMSKAKAVQEEILRKLLNRRAGKETSPVCFLPSVLNPAPSFDQVSNWVTPTTSPGSKAWGKSTPYRTTPPSAISSRHQSQEWNASIPMDNHTVSVPTNNFNTYTAQDRSTPSTQPELWNMSGQQDTSTPWDESTRRDTPPSFGRPPTHGCMPAHLNTYSQRDSPVQQYRPTQGERAIHQYRPAQQNSFNNWDKPGPQEASTQQDIAAEWDTPAQWNSPVHRPRPTHHDSFNNCNKPTQRETYIQQYRPTQGERPMHQERPAQRDSSNNWDKSVHQGALVQQDTNARWNSPAYRQRPTHHDSPNHWGSPAYRQRSTQRETSNHRDASNYWEKSIHQQAPAQQNTNARWNSSAHRQRPTQRDASNYWESSAYRQRSTHRDSSYHRDRSEQREASIQRDTYNHRDTFNHRDRSIHQEAPIQQDTIAQKDLPTQQDTSTQRDAPIQCHASAQWDTSTAWNENQQKNEFNVGKKNNTETEKGWASTVNDVQPTPPSSVIGTMTIAETHDSSQANGHPPSVRAPGDRDNCMLYPSMYDELNNIK